MVDLTLHVDSSWTSPWVFHALVALEEKRLPYKLETVTLPLTFEQRAALQQRAVLSKVPLLVHGDLWLSESLAISEYLAERFPAPDHPRLFPGDLAERARARQVLSFLRTSLFALRDERPAATVFGRPNPKPMSDRARADAAELIRVATAVIRPGAIAMFDQWCIADADLALALIRLVANQDPAAPALVDYAVAQWDRRSIRKYIAHLPTSR
jgi:glutathione S-transferase